MKKQKLMKSTATEITYTSGRQINAGDDLRHGMIFGELPDGTPTMELVSYHPEEIDTLYRIDEQGVVPTMSRIPSEN